MSTIKSSDEHLTLNADGSSKDIKFQANGVEKASIDSSGNVGIGVTPESWNSGWNTLQIGDGASIAGRTASGNVDISSNAYRESTDNRWEYIGANGSEEAAKYTQFSGQHVFYTAPSGSADAAITFSTKATIDSDGLKFNGDTASANALDDYEEGTFTATLTSGTPPSSPPTATGNYTKIGNRVHFEIFRFSNVDTSGGSGEMKITGLPFTLGTSAISGNIALRGFSFDTSKILFAELHSGTTTMNFVESTSGGVWGNLNITAGTGKYLAISGTYKI